MKIRYVEDGVEIHIVRIGDLDTLCGKPLDRRTKFGDWDSLYTIHPDDVSEDNLCTLCRREAQ